MLSDQTDSLVFDASVTINFLGTGIARECVQLLDRPVIMADRTFGEIYRHPIKGCNHVTELDNLVRTGHLLIEPLNNDAKELFYDLTGGNLSSGLDDGEAAAIALAVSKGHTTIIGIDDRKARTLLAARWPRQRHLYSLDLLMSQRLVSGLSLPTLAAAIHSALKHARMRVPISQRASIIDLVGIERARECPSIGSGV
jgi:hypothetical protein